MKKLFALLLALTMVLSLAACASTDNSDDTTPATDGSTPATGDFNTNAPASALEALENIWAAFGDEEKFPVIGGNMESPVDGAPGNYDMAYAENMTYNLLIPADQIANITEAASMIHMMNANTFTCGAFHLAEGVAAADFAATMQSAVQNNQWICGFPETLVIAVVGGEYVLVAFGNNAAMTPFQTHLSEVYPNAEVLYNEAIG